ncbi:hypothetical protein Tco_0199969 [Tanacetum coccineum]
MIRECKNNFRECRNTSENCRKLLKMQTPHSIPFDNAKILEITAKTQLESSNTSTKFTKCHHEFWSTAKVKTINGEAKLHALIYGKKIVITESSVRRDLQLADDKGVDCLPNSTIFEQLELMGLSTKTTAWNEFSSTMASAIIYLATT